MDHGSYQESYGYLWWIETLDGRVRMASGRGWGWHFTAVVPQEHLVVIKRHDTYGDGAGDGRTGMYVRQILAARTAPPGSCPRLMPFESPEQESGCGISV